MDSSSASALAIAFILLRAINYAFSWPLRESLYIPTVKEIKFKSKSWIDAFGAKFAKTTGSGFNYIAVKLAPELFMSAYSVFFMGIVGSWFFAAYFLGRRFDKAVEHNEVIGVSSELEPVEAK